MKLNCGPTFEEKHEAKKKWHKFFCLWPRRVGPRDCRWLEYVERKGTFWFGMFECGWIWEYRPL